MYGKTRGMAKISKPPVPEKMYKHFAAVTVVLTAAIAMFADDNRRAATEQSYERATTSTSSTRNTPAYGEARLVRAEARVQGSFGGEGDDGFGQPMMETGGDNRSSIARRAVNTSRQSLPNMTPEEVAALSQQEYERLLALYAAAGVIEDYDRSAQISEVEAASARRSGHGGSDS
jgi:hypothetical protein